MYSDLYSKPYVAMTKCPTKSKTLQSPQGYTIATCTALTMEALNTCMDKSGRRVRKREYWGRGWKRVGSKESGGGQIFFD